MPISRGDDGEPAGVEDDEEVVGVEVVLVEALLA